MKKKFLSIDKDVKIKADDSAQGVKLKGASTHELGGVSDRAFVEKHATAEDFAAMRAAIEAKAKAEGPAFQKLPDGRMIPAGHVLAFCTNARCAFAEFVDPAHVGKGCPLCNFQGLETDYAGRPAGHLREATPGELKAHLEWMKRDGARRAEQHFEASFNKNNAALQAAGRPPITREEFRELQKKDYADMIRASAREPIGPGMAAPVLEPLTPGETANIRKRLEWQRRATPEEVKRGY